jgi:hypothetical protein
MRTRINPSRLLFGALVAAALGFGASTATAAASEPLSAPTCPGYMNSAQACTDCCWNNYGAIGFWSPSTRICNCAL